MPIRFVHAQSDETGFACTGQKGSHGAIGRSRRKRRRKSFCQVFLADSDSPPCMRGARCEYNHLFELLYRCVVLELSVAAYKNCRRPDSTLNRWKSLDFLPAARTTDFQPPFHSAIDSQVWSLFS